MKRPKKSPPPALTDTERRVWRAQTYAEVDPDTEQPSHAGTWCQVAWFLHRRMPAPAWARKPDPITPQRAASLITPHLDGASLEELAALVHLAAGHGDSIACRECLAVTRETRRQRDARVRGHQRAHLWSPERELHAKYMRAVSVLSEALARRRRAGVPMIGDASIDAEVIAYLRAVPPR
jgi:hypothetical protein